MLVKPFSKVETGLVATFGVIGVGSLLTALAFGVMYTGVFGIHTPFQGKNLAKIIAISAGGAGVVGTIVARYLYVHFRTKQDMNLYLPPKAKDKS